MTQTENGKSVTIELTIHAQHGDWPLAIHLALTPAQIGPALDRLEAYGLTPRRPYPGMDRAPIAPQNGAQQAAPINGVAMPSRNGKPAPVTNDRGELCCPIHQRPLKGPNKWQKLFCTHKNRDGQYCDYTAQA